VTCWPRSPTGETLEPWRGWGVREYRRAAGRGETRGGAVEAGRDYDVNKEGVAAGVAREHLPVHALPTARARHQRVPRRDPSALRPQHVAQSAPHHVFWLDPEQRGELARHERDSEGAARERHLGDALARVLCRLRVHKPRVLQPQRQGRPAGRPRGRDAQRVRLPVRVVQREQLWWSRARLRAVVSRVRQHRV